MVMVGVTEVMVFDIVVVFVIVVVVLDILEAVVTVFDRRGGWSSSWVKQLCSMISSV